MDKLLWIGDAGVPSGFAKATHAILDTLRDHYDVTVLGINYRGDPHQYSYPIYVAAIGGHRVSVGRPFGVDRLLWMCDLVKPDVIVIQNDGWNIPLYTQQLARTQEYSNVPVVAAVAVDGKNFIGPWLTGVSMAIFWTQFALDEARLGGYAGPATVIPLGVDTWTYRPEDKKAARLERLKGYLTDDFIVGAVGRNQPRKRLDLTIKYFSEWVHAKKVNDAYLYIHSAPTGDNSVDILQLAKYYDVYNKLVTMEPEVFYGMTEDDMSDTYNCFDVYMSTTQGEGFGLPALEAMACGVPCILPDWAAFGDWAKRGAWLVPCTSTAINSLPYGNVVGGVPDERKFIEALHALYVNKEARAHNAKAALECAQQEQFQWKHIGQRWVAALEGVLENSFAKDKDLIAPSVPSETPA